MMFGRRPSAARTIPIAARQVINTQNHRTPVAFVCLMEVPDPDPDPPVPSIPVAADISRRAAGERQPCVPAWNCRPKAGSLAPWPKHPSPA